ncbi:hypothetical protein LJC34_01075 [Oscillospiraceae bacterium OttesenSCG-928-G22]|nr:hypothetical protein [Oscillospiraceae bacterium OttesenSCG-928-G22]
MLEFAAVMSKTNIIDMAGLPDSLRAFRPVDAAANTETLSERVRRFEREEAFRAVSRHGESLEGKRRAAAELGISLATLYNKLRDNSQKLE